MPSKNVFLSISIQVFIFLGFIFPTIAQQGNYDNYKVYDVTPINPRQRDFLKSLCESGYDCFNEIIAIDNTIQIMVKPEKEIEFYDLNITKNLKAAMNVPNMQTEKENCSAYLHYVGDESGYKMKNEEICSFIDAQIKPVDESVKFLNFTWDRYHDLEKIYNWLDLLELKYPVVSTTVIGKTHEGRDIKGITIDFYEGSRRHNYYGMIEGGIHAREWISPATVTWIIKEFITSKDTNTRIMAEALIWHIFPVVNPDGYAYTFSNDRLWKTNRNYKNDSFCPGVDLNRNFDYKWSGINKTNFVNCQNYPGTHAASEPETIAIKRHVLALRKRGTVLYYFSFHSYAQLIMFPFTYGYQRAKNYLHLRRMVRSGSDTMSSVHGSTYMFGSANELHYNVQGSSIDWMRAKGRVPIVILFELRDTGLFGFLLPTSQIIPNNEEVMTALVEIDQVTRQLHYYSVMKLTGQPILRKSDTNSSSLTAISCFIFLLSSFFIGFWVHSTS